MATVAGTTPERSDKERHPSAAAKYAQEEELLSDSELLL